MDHRLNMDFCFLCPGGLLAVAGWTAAPRPDLAVHAGSGTLNPVHLARFPRRDLRSIEPLGYLAIFDISADPGALDDPSEEIFVAMGTEHVRVSGSRLVTDARKIVEIGVDEAFFTLLRLIASGSLPLPAPTLAQLMITRILAAPQLPPEADTHALALEQAVVAPGGQGVASGWFLPTGATAGDLAALVFDDHQLARVALHQGCVPRPDLAPYGNRFLFGGSDGWLASFRLEAPRQGKLRLLTMLPGQLTEAGVLGAVAEGPATKVARLLLEARGFLTDSARADDLHRGTLPPADAAAPAEAGTGVPLPPDAPILLTLDHDLPAQDLRDVLRRLSRVTGRPILLHLLQPELTLELREAVLGAAREAARPLTIAGWGGTLPAAAPGPALLVFARSSVLFHLDGRLQQLEAAEAHDLQVMMLDVMLAFPGGATRLTERFLSDRPAFLCWGDAARLLPRLARIGADALVPETAFRRLAEDLQGQNRLALTGADATGFHAGTEGPFAVPLIDTLTPHDFDALSARLSSKEFA